MQPETTAKHEQDSESPVPKTESATKTANTAVTGITSTNEEGATTTKDQLPPAKPEKPRPHVCATCGRSFARLEHLKRHERSHTKEKPFECPECARCFARRDLLLRHQQKLHMTNPTSSRPRNARRESVSGASVASARVRKNSVVNANPNGLGHSRPRANTISHIDLASLGLMDSAQPGLSRVNSLGLYSGSGADMSGMSMSMDFGTHSAPQGHINGFTALPKLDMNSINNMEMTDSLYTAPPMASFEAATGFNLDQLFGPGTTVNPAQLHFGGGGANSQPNPAQFSNYEHFSNQHPVIPEGDDFTWMRHWNAQLGAGLDAHEQAIDESSPSRMSSGDSPAEYNDLMTNSAPTLNQPFSNHTWSQRDVLQVSSPSNAFQLDALGSGLPNLDQSSLQDQPPSVDLFFQHAMLQQNSLPINQSPQTVQSSVNAFFATPSISNVSSDSPSMSSSSMNGSARQSSVTSASTDSITDSTRQALLSSLALPSVFGHNHRKYSQPSISSPLSPSSNQARSALSGFNLPSTADIRRYVDAFVQYAHPHLPVTHVPTLTFDAHEYSTSSGTKGTSSGGIHGGGGCLILAMAAIGALYEYEHLVSKELFEAGKKMISLYLEERRRTTVSVGAGKEASMRDTPLWLVQAMLLHVIYGHQCGDRTSADIASNHCAALVSLARSADLVHPPHTQSPTDSGTADKVEIAISANDVEMSNGINAQAGTHTARGGTEIDLQQQWLEWVNIEKRKRTLFAIFIISSLLTTAYNQTPTIMNSEILLDLPCDEDLWAAESAQEWHSRGGLAAAEAGSLSFAGALSTLLTANQRQYNGGSMGGALHHGGLHSESELKPSTFGCLVLINALHNYIWETRSRHHGRQWTTSETESMFAHIEPALNAWQAAWKANEHHRLERPNPFGLGPLSSDSIPLLDLAFVRLFVNLGRAKEAFWARDYDTMANELARGTEIVQHAEITNESRPRSDQLNMGNQAGASAGHESHSTVDGQSSSRREKHLRKAAFYAADSLTIACNYNLTYADMSAHELPIQSAMCFFDCSQVLAEWACTVQERVGQYLGVLGREEVEWTQVPAIMVLETEDIDLLKKMERITESLETKRFQHDNLLSLDVQSIGGGVALPMQGSHHGVSLASCGYGSRLLRVVGTMLEKAVVWPVTHVMAKAIETQAAHMDRRAEASRT